MKLRKRTSDTSPEFQRIVEQETLILAATEALCELMEKQGISRADLAREMGKTRGFVTQLLSGERNMTLRTLADCAFALNVRMALSWDWLESTRHEPEVRWESFEDSANVARAIESDPLASTRTEEWNWWDILPAYARLKSRQVLEHRSVQPPSGQEAISTKETRDGAAA